MSNNRRSHVTLWAAVIALIVICIGSCFAAKPKVTVKRASSGKLYVPAKMISGSALVKNRAFYPPSIYESTLAGIRLGRPAKEVLAKWGNPTRITLGSVQGQESRPQQQMPGIPYTPSSGGMEPMGVLGSLPGVSSLPGLPGLTAPGMPSMPGAPPSVDSGAPSGGGESAALRQEEVTWTYDLANGITLEFIITEGTVTQITVGGIGPWGLSRTRTGLQLGDSYKLVLYVCGYPESQRFQGRFLRLSYVEKSRALFTMMDKKVVGVTIALVPQEIASR